MTLKIDCIKALIMDFDGVFTDNKVYLDAEGRELVRCDRGDGMGISILRRSALPMIVISTEVNPVVAARCAKLKLKCIHGIDDKLPVMLQWLDSVGVDAQDSAYIGNDVNDLSCMRAVGLSIAPADAHHLVLAECGLVLKATGGNGAVRELCDLVMDNAG